MSKLTKQLILAAGLAIATTGAAFAEGGDGGDSSMNPFIGDSHAYFNRALSNAPADRSWRQSHPNGLSEREFQELSSEGPAWQLNQPVFSNAPADSSWRQSHPNGLTERELMALSSEASAWQLSNNPSGSYAVVSTDQTNVAQSAAKRSLGDRIANFFHVARGGQVDSAR